MTNSTETISKQSRRHFAKSILAILTATPLLSSLTGCWKKTPMDEGSFKIIARAIRMKASTVRGKLKDVDIMDMQTKDKLAYSQQAQNHLWGERTRGIVKVMIEGKPDKLRPNGATHCKIELRVGTAIKAKIYDVQRDTGNVECYTTEVEGPFPNNPTSCNEVCLYPGTEEDLVIQEAYIKWVYCQAGIEVIVKDESIPFTSADPFKDIAVDFAIANSKKCPKPEEEMPCG